MWDENEHDFVSYRCSNCLCLMSKYTDFEIPCTKHKECNCGRSFCSEECMDEDLAKTLFKKALQEAKEKSNV